MLSTLCQSGSVATLESLNMHKTADFSTDEACMYLAQLIDTALALKELDISYQKKGTRSVKLIIEYADVSKSTDDKLVPKQGCIKVVDEFD